MSDNSPDSSRPSAGVLRRLGAMFYDALLIVALLMVITAVLLALTGGEAITAERNGLVAESLYRAVLLAVVVGFFGGFWTRTGQTLGMAAWRLKIVRDDGSLLTWSDALMRLAAACVSWLAFGLGYVWIWFDRDRLAWHDRWTHTRVTVLPKR